MSHWKRGVLIDPLDQGPATGESFETLCVLNGVRVERISSSSAPDTSFQQQPHDEWVALLRGEATLEFVTDGRTTRVSLVAGETLFIAAHMIHRVAETTQGALWLALHAPPEPKGPPRHQR